MAKFTSSDEMISGAVISHKVNTDGTRGYLCTSPFTFYRTIDGSWTARTMSVGRMVDRSADDLLQAQERHGNKVADLDGQGAFIRLDSSTTAEDADQIHASGYPVIVTTAAEVAATALYWEQVAYDHRRKYGYGES